LSAKDKFKYQVNKSLANSRKIKKKKTSVRSHMSLTNTIFAIGHIAHCMLTFKQILDIFKKVK